MVKLLLTSLSKELADLETKMDILGNAQVVKKQGLEELALCKDIVVA